ncbi:unannotated protein [freshwater metagenome]|uniref:Unannotated protein n=1 Tax=freshwater metagenome TaxID=449393 RepID=A0A6J6I2H6_9ZZZZ
MPATKSTSLRQSSKLLQAMSDGSLKTVGFTFSANQVSLFELLPSTWWPAVAVAQIKSGENVRAMGGSSTENVDCGFALKFCGSTAKSP